MKMMEKMKESVSFRVPEKLDFESAKKIIYQMEKCICKVIKRKGQTEEQNTGFFCKIPISEKNNKLFPVLIITNHIIDEKLLYQKGEKILIIMNNDQEIKTIYLDNRIKYTNKKFDVTIIEIKDEDDIKDYLELDDIIISDIFDKKNKNFEFMDQTIYIIQYPQGKLSVSFGILDTIYKSQEYNFQYKCDTKTGSSGSPILNKKNKLIGIHIKQNYRSGYKTGTFLNFPIKEFIKMKSDNIIKKDNLNNIIDSDKSETISKEFMDKYNLDIKDNYIDILDLNNKNIEDEELKELSKLKIKILKELNLSNNLISDIEPLEKLNFLKLEILNLSHNKISNINILEKVNCYNLKILDLSHNNISDINALGKMRLQKLEQLNLGCNKIQDIEILGKINFEKLKYLNSFDNEISDIKVLEKVNFINIEFLNLGANKISDIDILEKVNFTQLKILYLNINNISNIKILEKVKFEKLQELNLCENNINESQNINIIQNLKTKIKKFDINIENNSYSSPMNVGIIFDVSYDILSQIIKFNNEKSFLENFCNEFNGDLITLINGNEQIPYYDFSKLLLSTINYVNDKDTISSKKRISTILRNLFDEPSIIEILQRMNSYQNLFELTNSKIIHKNILTLKEIISRNYSTYIPNFFEYFDQLILKPSSVNLSIKKIFEIFNMTYSENKYIIIISDGNSKENKENINDIINE